MALHRLKPLLGAFEHIDAAIEAAADAGSCRDEFRRARARLVEMVCDAAAADDGAGGHKAEGLCALLDEAMAGSLATLRVVPLEETALESGGLVGAVDTLMREHPSARIRGLAGDVVRGWRSGVKAEIAMARAKLDALPSTPPPPPPHVDTAPAAESDTKSKKTPEEQARPRKPAIVSSGRRARTAESYAPLSKTRSDPIVSSSHRVSTTKSFAPLPIKESAPIIVTTGNAKPSATVRAPTVVPTQPKKTPPGICSSIAEKIPKEQPGPRKSAVISSNRPVRTAECYGPLSKTSSDPIVSSSRRVSTAENYAPLPITKSAAVVVTTRNATPSVSMGAPTAVPAQPKKKTPPVIISAAEEEKLEATKRKLHQRYQEAEDAKRQRTIQVIKPPRPPPATTGQRQRIVHSGVRARGPASCASERMFNKSRSLRMKV